MFKSGNILQHWVGLGSLVLLPVGAAAQSGSQFKGQMDSVRARELYVSNRPEDHPVADYARDIEARNRTDSINVARSAGVLDYRKVSYRSRVDGLERVDSPAQIDSWNRTWAFFDWILRPYEDRSKPLAECATRDCSRRRATP